MFRSTLMALAALLALSACGEKSSDEKKVGTQVSVKVNKGQISVHQLNNVLSRAGSVKPEQAKLTSKQILDKLVEQELLVQQAMERKA